MTKRAKFAFGDILTTKLPRLPFRGRVTIAYENFGAVIEAFAADDDWWDQQLVKPSSRTQVFYAIVGLDNDGSILIGEDDVAESMA